MPKIIPGHVTNVDGMLMAVTVPLGGAGGFGTTVTTTLDVLPYALSVIVVVPSATAVTTPSSPDAVTVATAGLLLVQLNTRPPLGVAPTSVTDGESVDLSPSWRE